MITTHTKHIAIIATCFCLLAIAALSVLLYDLTRKAHTFEEHKKLVAESTALEQRRTILERRLEETTDERAALKTHILSEADTITFLTQIEQIARGQGIELETRDLRVTQQEGELFDELSISFAARGSLAQQLVFLETLETLPYQGRVEQVTLSGGASATEQQFSNNINMILSIETYD